MKVILAPKTRKGNNVIRKSGGLVQWTVRILADRVLFNPEPGPWALIESQKDSRWVHLTNDADFAVEVIDD